MWCYSSKKKRTFKSRLLDLVLSLYWLRSHVKQHLPPPALQGSTEQARSASEVWWERGQSRIKRGFLSPLLSLIINSWQISPKGDREQLGTRQPANTRFYHLFSTYWLKTSSKINWEKNNCEIRKLHRRYLIHAKFLFVKFFKNGPLVKNKITLGNHISQEQPVDVQYQNRVLKRCSAI